MKLSASVFAGIIKTANEEFSHLVSKEETTDAITLEGRQHGESSRAEAISKLAALIDKKAATGEYEKMLDEILNRIDNDIRDPSKHDNKAKTFVLAVITCINQVHNGGWMQWIDNGYAKTYGDYLLRALPDNDPEFPTLSTLRRLVISVHSALENLADEHGESFEDFSEVEDLTSDLDDEEKMRDRYKEENEYNLDRAVDMMGTAEKNSMYDSVLIEYTAPDGKEFTIEDESSARECGDYIEELPDDQFGGDDFPEKSEVDQGIDMVIGFFEGYDNIDSDGRSIVYDALEPLNVRLYKSIMSEPLAQEIIHFAEANMEIHEMGEVVESSLQDTFKVGSWIRPLGSRPFRVTAAASIGNDFKVQAKYLDGTTEILSGHNLSVIKPLNLKFSRVAAMMIKAYNKDFDLYVKNAIQEAGLPVDNNMNWSSYLERIYKSVAKDPETRDEAAHHMIILHLYQLRALDKFDQTKSPDQENPLEKKVTTYLKKMFSYSVSKAHKWVEKTYGYGIEMQPEVGQGEDTVNLFDTLDTGKEDDQTEFESASDISEFKKEFFPWLTRKWGKKVGPNLAILFELTLKHDDEDKVWEEFQATSGKSFSYFKKAIANLRIALSEFISKDLVHPSNLLVKMLNDYNKRLLNIEEEGQSKPVESSIEKEEDMSGKTSHLKKLISSKKKAAEKLSRKFAAIKRIAEEDPEAVGEALAELRTAFQENAEALEVLAEHLDLTEEDQEEGKLGSAFRRIAEEEPAELEAALKEIYGNIDVIADGVENLAEHLGITLVEDFPEEEGMEHGDTNDEMLEHEVEMNPEMSEPKEEMM